jgi:hypothetical protein
MPTEAGLRQFLSDWHATQSPRTLVERLPPLFATLRPLLRPIVSAAGTELSTAGAMPDTGQLAAVLEELGPLLTEHRQQGGEINVWRLAGLKRAEVRNAAVLAALWSPASLGDRAVTFLDNFLQRLRPQDGLPSSGELARRYVVRTEHCATGAATERVDITVEGENFVLAIEVKIDAGEGPDQLIRYRQSVDEWSRARNKRGGLILLAPFRSAVAGIVNADWNDVASAANATLPSKRLSFTHADRLLDDFARHVVAFRGAKQ